MSNNVEIAAIPMRKFVESLFNKANIIVVQWSGYVETLYASFSIKREGVLNTALCTHAVR